MKKDREYMPILDRPIEELKKPMGRPVDFGAVMKQLLSYKVDKKKKKVARIATYSYHPSLASHITISTTASIKLKAKFEVYTSSPSIVI